MSKRFAPAEPQGVVVLGAGIAGLESVMALRYFAGPRARVTLVGAEDAFVLDALAPLAAFGLTRQVSHDVARIAAAHDTAFVHDKAVAVDTTRKHVHLESGRVLPWQRLVVALGARPAPAFEHCLTAAPQNMGHMVRRLHAEMLSGAVRSIAFVVPPGVSWALPIYELALLTRREADAHRVQVAITIVTTASRPLELFGPLASRSVQALLDEAHIAFEGDSYAVAHHGGRVTIRPFRRAVQADRVVALPRLEGPFLDGLPHDAAGFLPVDPAGRVRGALSVYAAGDCTDFPVKHGGLAAQQADAAASEIASRLGATATPERFRPLLRGRLVVGSQVTSMRHHVGGGAGEGRSSTHGWWGPQAKLSARFLTPWLERGHNGVIPDDLEDLPLAPTVLPA